MTDALTTSLIDAIRQQLTPVKLSSKLVTLCKAQMKAKASDGLVGAEQAFFVLLDRLQESPFDSEAFAAFVKQLRAGKKARQYLLSCFCCTFTLLPFSVVTRLSVMAMLEGDGTKTRWVQLALHLMEDGVANGQLHWPMEFFTLSRGSVVIRGKEKEIPLFGYYKGLKVIQAAAKKAVDTLGEQGCQEKLVAEALARQRKLRPWWRKTLDAMQEGKLLLKGAAPKQSVAKPRTVVFVGSRAFPSEANTHFSVLHNAATAIKRGDPAVTVKLALSPEDVLISPWCNFGLYDGPRSEYHQRKWSSIQAEPEAIYPQQPVAAEQFDKLNYLTDMLQWIEDQSPDLVVFLSGVYQSYVLRTLCYARFKTVFLPTSVNHVPKGFFDVVVSTRDIYHQRLQSAGIDADKIFQVPAALNVALNNDAYTAETVRMHEDDCIVATVIGGGRLYKALAAFSADELASLVQLFDDCPHLVWLLVGESQFDKVVALSPGFERLRTAGRLRSMGYVKELRDFYRQVDVVFNLPGVAGGGQSIAAAIHEGLPVMTSVYSDCTSFVPKSGQFADVPQALSLLRDLASNSKHRQQLAELCTSKFAEHAIDKVAAKWVGLLDH